jgi:hypothetical protein
LFTIAIYEKTIQFQYRAEISFTQSLAHFLNFALFALVTSMKHFAKLQDKLCVKAEIALISINLATLCTPYPAPPGKFIQQYLSSKCSPFKLTGV